MRETQGRERVRESEGVCVRECVGGERESEGGERERERERVCVKGGREREKVKGKRV